MVAMGLYPQVTVVQNLDNICDETEVLGIAPQAQRETGDNSLRATLKTDNLSLKETGLLLKTAQAAGIQACFKADGHTATARTSLTGNMIGLYTPSAQLAGSMLQGPSGKQPREAMDTLHKDFILRCGPYTLNLSRRTHIMGILNVTPDSFSDGNAYLEPAQAVIHAKQMVAQGADIIDIGGESSRPGSESITPQAELDRIMPVLEGVLQEVDVPVSIDTYKAEVAKAALESGAHIINDISGLRFDPDMAPVIARYGAPVVIMHIKGTPKDMQRNPIYESLIEEIIEYLKQGIELACAAGIDPDQIVIDPGIGFGKTVQHNLQILNRLSEFSVLGKPVLVGTSRKSFIGQILGLPVEQREEGTAASVSCSILNGAHIVRVHDVAKMAQVVKLTDAIKQADAYSHCEG
jgi:dihydropteroate synthase